MPGGDAEPGDFGQDDSGNGDHSVFGGGLGADAGGFVDGFTQVGTDSVGAAGEDAPGNDSIEYVVLQYGTAGGGDGASDMGGGVGVVVGGAAGGGGDYKGFRGAELRDTVFVYGGIVNEGMAKVYDGAIMRVLSYFFLRNILP